MTRRRRAATVAAALPLAFLGACTSTNVLALGVGDCLQSDVLEGDVSDVAVVPCSDPHDAEVYAILGLTGEGYPGIEAVSTAAEEFCLPEFEQFVGVSYPDSEIVVYPLLPTQDSWTEQGDRDILCIAVAPEPVQGSLKDAGR